MLLDIYLLRPGSSLISCNNLPRISDHKGILLEAEWDEICREPKAESVVPVYHNTNVTGLQAFPREKFNTWAGNGRGLEEISKSYKDTIFDGIKHYVPQTILSKNPKPEYYYKKEKRLKIKVIKKCKNRKSGQPYQAELKRLSKE